MADPRYPIGPFKFDKSVTPQKHTLWIQHIDEAPGKLRAALEGLSESDLDKPYRSGGWTVRQLVHHVADSHLNAYIRFRLALTEDSPPVKTYEQDRWAELPDAKTAPVDTSLALLEALHTRWAILLRSMKPEDFARTFTHPDWKKISLENTLQIYAWHGRHHTAHVLAAKGQKV